jgi:hypothetical protein
MSAFGSNSLLAAWQDQRLGPLVDDDLWANLLDASLSSVGGEFSLLGVSDHQQRPRLATNETFGIGLVVWQDLRGAIGITYAATVDGSGNPMEPDGFPVFAFQGNVIEHAVATGPGNDFLVLGVRTDLPEETIVYRVVRGQPPSGPMTPAPLGSTRADGVTPANVIFFPDPSAYETGFLPVDGTLYTVTMRRAPIGDVSRTGRDESPHPRAWLDSGEHRLGGRSLQRGHLGSVQQCGADDQ